MSSPNASPNPSPRKDKEKSEERNVNKTKSDDKQKINKIIFVKSEDEKKEEPVVTVVVPPGDDEEEKSKKPKKAKKKSSREKTKTRSENERKKSSREKEMAKSDRDKDKDKEKTERRKATPAGTPAAVTPAGTPAASPAKTPKEPTAKPSFNFQTPKDEVELSTLQLEGQSAANAQLMEQYKIALQQIHNSMLMMMRRGNGTVDMENIKSEKLHTGPERLNKFVAKTENFWKLDTKLQPAMNESISKNTSQLGQLERHLQEQGPKHLKKIKKFIYQHYPTYMEMKKELAKIVTKHPENTDGRADVTKKIDKFVKDKYLNVKHLHVAEMQAAFAELGLFHRSATSFWYQISERKNPKSHFSPEHFDFKQFFNSKQHQ